jgi:hypothetical protein
MTDGENKQFLERVQRGRRFEAEEHTGWAHIPKGQIQFEAKTRWQSKCGRIDILISEADGSASIIENKATDWDSLKPHRIMPTVKRHARQVWRYVNDFVEGQAKQVCPGIVYEREPKSRTLRAFIENELNEYAIQVVWRKGISQERPPGMLTLACKAAQQSPRPNQNRGG